ncbi:MAG: alanine racemase [Candidatus Liptonbacteria bacterium]|nr:alanine racemase [Candidatus Liptonbacteria bacterium]
MTHRSSPRERYGLRTWLELDREAARQNVRAMRGLLTPRTRLMAVVKSNAYGHGLYVFAKVLDRLGVHGFCVDSVLEGFRLRKEGITKPILVLGSTLPEHFGAAAESRITLTLSTFEGVKAYLRTARKPEVHLKIDTGMHRQGFFPTDARRAAELLRRRNVRDGVTGLYTHFASAKDITYPAYTERQFEKFLEAERALQRAGFRNLVRHASATAGTMLGHRYHLDWVRSGIALYGYYPSRELEVQLRRPGGGRSPDRTASGLPSVELKPVLSWHAIVTEVKRLPAGAFVGYDLTERLERPTAAAVLPIGYWHGIPRILSGTGRFILGRVPARILGRVSMDMTVIDATDARVKVGSVATLDIKDAIAKSGTTSYEFLTRINPLIERVVV